jgi:hypothetical protein
MNAAPHSLTHYDLCPPRSVVAPPGLAFQVEELDTPFNLLRNHFDPDGKEEEEETASSASGSASGGGAGGGGGGSKDAEGRDGGGSAGTKPATTATTTGTTTTPNTARVSKSHGFATLVAETGEETARGLWHQVRGTLRGRVSEARACVCVWVCVGVFVFVCFGF